MYQSTLAQWHFLYLYGYIFNYNEAEEFPDLCKKIANGALFSKENNFVKKWFNRIHKLIAKCPEQHGEHERDKNTQHGFNLKNWLRSTVAFKKLKEEIKYIELKDYPL